MAFPGATLPPAASTPVDAIISYYALVPNDLSLAWSRLTANYQQNGSGGLQAYRQFWSTIAQVTVTDVSLQDDGSVEATITYAYNSGRVDDERTRFTLLDDDGQLRIDSSAVLSSHTR